MTSERQRVLVTGAAGFVGSHLCDRLLGRGCDVIGVDNLATGNMRNLEHLANEQRFEFLQKDITQPFKTGPINRLYNFASPASPRDYARLGVETLLVGSAGTMHMLEMAREHNATFIQASTSECYGDPAVHPQPETYWGNVNPIGPRSVYDEAKRFSEAAVMAYHRYHGLRTRTVRIFNTYGPRLQANDGRVISEFLNQALQGKPLTIYGDGSQTRSFCYVSDLVEGILRLSDSEEVMPVNLGNPDEWTILECAREVQSLIPNAPGIVFQALPQDDPTRRKPDITKATTLLNWKPAVNLREGLAETLTYFREQLNRNPSAVQAST
jgi:dTDP-glucose 4,6-dehydratase